MNIPKGATHVDDNGDYWEPVPGDSVQIQMLGTGGMVRYDRPYAYLLHGTRLIEEVDQRKTEYPGQFEPYNGLRCLIADEVAAEDHQLVSAAVLAGVAMQEMMRC